MGKAIFVLILFGHLSVKINGVYIFQDDTQSVIRGNSKN